MRIDEMQERKRLLGLSYEMIAQLSGVPLGTVQKVLGGITKSPRRDTLIALEKVLGVPEAQKVSSSGGRITYTGKAMPDKSSKVNSNSATTYENSIRMDEGGSGMVCESNSYYNAGTSALTERKNSIGRLSETRRISAQTLAGGEAAKMQEFDFNQKKSGRSGNFTVEDYLKLPDDQRYELIDGFLYGMAAPSLTHQELIGDLYFQLRQYVERQKGSCKVLMSPVDVQLNCDNYTMVQPDLIILCDPAKAESRKRIIGAPDFVAEILSESTARKDLTLKLYKYKEAGVHEYWIIDPEEQRIIVHDLEKGMLGLYPFGEKVPVQIYHGECMVSLALDGRSES